MTKFVWVLIERTKLMNDELKNEGYSYQVKWEPETFGIGRRLQYSISGFK